MTHAPAGYNHIIQSNANVPLLATLRDVVLTGLVWLLYAYFVQDVFDIFGDIRHWSLDGFSDTLGTTTFHVLHSIALYVDIILVVEVIFASWSLYNLLRFRNKTRRHQPPPATIGDLAALYHFTLEEVYAWQHAQIIVIRHDAEGHIADVQTNAPVEEEGVAADH